MIQPLRGAAPKDLAPPRGAPPAEAAPEPVDSFAPTRAEEPRSTRLAARILGAAGALLKGERDYQVRAWTLAPEGRVYVAYADARDRSRGYLACVEPGGRVAWEAPLEIPGAAEACSAPALALSASGQGVVLHSPGGRVVFDSQGHRLARHAFPEKLSPYQVWTDPSGATYGLSAEGHGLRALDAQGRPLALDVRLSGAYVSEVRTLPDGTLQVEAGGKILRLAPGGAVLSEISRPAPPAEGSTVHSTCRVFPGPQGGYVVEMNASTPMSGPHAHMFRRPFGPGWGGPICMDSMDWGPEYIESRYLVGLDAQGQKLWETERLGSSPTFAVLPTGDVYLAGYTDGQGQTPVHRLDSQGKKGEVAFRLQGGCRSMQAAPDGTLLVDQGQAVSRFDPASGRLERVELGAERSGFSLLGGLPDGRLLFSADSGRELWVYDWPATSWTRLTDRQVDHSASVLARQLDLPFEDPGQVAVEEEWIQVGEVRLPRREG
ncbi:MAG TPA: hypothetical protein VNO81_02835 [Candidatus Nitrosotenuis sp.]|nr:hypothetical protein [Candidatus Nitrosotenuis sp.]